VKTDGRPLIRATVSFRSCLEGCGISFGQNVEKKREWSLVPWCCLTGLTNAGLALKNASSSSYDWPGRFYGGANFF